MKKITVGLTMSVMLLAIVAIATAPAFAAHKIQFAQFDPSTLPDEGTKYVIEISGKARTVHQDKGVRFVGGDANLLVPNRSIWSPVSGQVIIKAAVDDRTPFNSNQLSKLRNANAAGFVVESGTIKIGDKTYAVDSGVATYYKKFSLTINGPDLALQLRGALSGGIPGLDSLSSMTHMQKSLKLDGERWLFLGGITKSALV
jgi:hypothetical protein